MIKRIADLVNDIYDHKINKKEANKELIKLFSETDSVEYTKWLRNNYTVFKNQINLDLLPENMWRKDYTTKTYSTEDLYLIFKGSIK